MNESAYAYADLNPLDKIRITGGKEKLKLIFKDLIKNQPETAVKYINDKRLSFASLFLLFPEIHALNLYEQLSEKNIHAISICVKMQKKQKLVSRGKSAFEETHETLYPLLKWMLITGAEVDGESYQFDEIMDTTASLLTRSYLDKTVLPVIEKMIFKRHQNGRYIHDLAWAFFQIHDVEVLKLVASHLRSSKSKDVELASRLLNLPYAKENGKNTGGQRLYDEYMSWLKENDKHLYFTGESFNLTSSPKPCKVDFAAKYLCREISPFDRKPLLPLTESENQLLEQFNSLSNEEKQMLSSYSHKMRNRNSHEWNKWQKRPLDQQLLNAKNGKGGIR